MHDPRMIGNFLKALLLARLRLPSRHPLVLHIYRSWAQDFRRRGRQDQAALCFFATKETCHWTSSRVTQRMRNTNVVPLVVEHLLVSLLLFSKDS